MGADTGTALRERASENRVTAGWAIGLWALCAAAYGVWVKLRYDLHGAASCPVPGTDSDFGEASWGWLPPGETCTYPRHFGIATSRPGWIAPALLVVFPIIVIALWVFSEMRVRSRMERAS